MAKTAQDKKWEVEDATRTLIRAEEIRANRQLMAQAKKELAKQQKAVSKAISKAKNRR